MATELTTMQNKILSPSEHTQEAEEDIISLSGIAVKPLVLAADDNETILKFIKRLVESNGFECITTNSPTTAVRIAEEKHPSIILCDINFGIGKLNAMDVFSEIRSKNADVPFVIVTAILQQESREKAEKIGITEYIIKPIDPEQMIATLRKLVNRKSIIH